MNRIKELRKEFKYTQEKLAKKIGVSRSAIAMYETTDCEPSNEILKYLAILFDVSIDYLLGISDIKKASPSQNEDASLSENERDLLKDFRQLTKDQQRFILQAVQAEALRQADEQKK